MEYSALSPVISKPNCLSAIGLWANETKQRDSNKSNAESLARLVMSLKNERKLNKHSWYLTAIQDKQRCIFIDEATFFGDEAGFWTDQTNLAPGRK